MICLAYRWLMFNDAINMHRPLTLKGHSHWGRHTYRQTRVLLCWSNWDIVQQNVSLLALSAFIKPKQCLRNQWTPSWNSLLLLLLHSLLIQLWTGFGYYLFSINLCLIGIKIFWCESVVMINHHVTEAEWRYRVNRSGI